MSETSEQIGPDAVFHGDGEPVGQSRSAEETLRAWMREFEGPLLRYAGRILGPDSGDPEDVVQQVFIRCFEYMMRNGPDSIRNPASWLFRVAHNLARDAGRRRRRWKGLRKTAEEDPVFPAPDAPASPEAALDRELRHAVLDELDALPDLEKEILVLKFDQGLTLRDICEVTGMKLSTVHYHLQRGLRMLAERLRARGLLDNGTTP